MSPSKAPRDVAGNTNTIVNAFDRCGAIEGRKPGALQLNLLTSCPGVALFTAICTENSAMLSADCQNNSGVRG